jgi:hypothetical protein
MVGTLANVAEGLWRVTQVPPQRTFLDTVERILMGYSRVGSNPTLVIIVLHHFWFYTILEECGGRGWAQERQSEGGGQVLIGLGMMS